MNANVSDCLPLTLRALGNAATHYPPTSQDMSDITDSFAMVLDAIAQLKATADGGRRRNYDYTTKHVLTLAGLLADVIECAVTDLALHNIETADQSLSHEGDRRSMEVVLEAMARIQRASLGVLSW